MKRNIFVAAGVVVGIGALALGYYATSPLFRNVRVDEVLPGTGQMEEMPTRTQNQPQPTQRVATAQVMGTTGHPASGTVRVVKADGTTYVRYENFKTINGPDIYVYLAKDLEAKEFVNLGGVRATEGNINYEVPAGVDVTHYPYVLTWCRAFGVLFNYADLSQTR